MNKPIYAIAIAAIITLSAFYVAPAAAQEAMSPYSRFGYGLLNNNASAAQRQMGGVGYAMNSGRQINVMNPASYAMMDSLTFLFDMGMDFTTLMSNENGVKDKRYGGGLDYLTMQFPLGRYVGASVGLLPYSSVGYSFGNDITGGKDSRSGIGGLNQLYAGVGVRPFKGFSVGVNVSYLFGNTINDTYVYSDYATSLFEQTFDVRDWHFQAGVQYTLALGRKNDVTLGVVYTPGKTLLGKATVIKYDVTSSEAPDTVSRMNLDGNFSLPDTWGAGIAWRWDGRLMIEADYTYQPWAKAKFKETDNFIATRFADRRQFSLGAQYCHAQRGNYFKRITYRVGGLYNQDYMKVGLNNVRDYGVSVGFGLPTIATKTIINLGFEWRHRQAHPAPLLKENYFNVTLGVNFNELWFFKNKIR